MLKPDPAAALTLADLARIDFAKGDGLVPCIVQEWQGGAVLMLGYMNLDAAQATLANRRVTFWSRSKRALWTKGETSGNVLELVSLHLDCDNDTLLAFAKPAGPTCHTGTHTCFGEDVQPPLAVLGRLEAMIQERRRTRPPGSYTTRLFDAGTRRIAQKVGEEGVETALAAVAQTREALVSEAADLLYHLTVLLADRDASLSEVTAELTRRQVAAGK